MDLEIRMKKNEMSVKEFANKAGKHPDTIIRWLKSFDCPVKAIVRNKRYFLPRKEAEVALGLADEFPVEDHDPVLYEAEQIEQEAEYLIDSLSATVRAYKAQTEKEGRIRIARSLITNQAPKFQQFSKRIETNIRLILEESDEEIA